MSAAENLVRWLRTDDPADRKPDVPHVEGCHQLDAEAVETALPAIQREARAAERAAIRAWALQQANGAAEAARAYTVGTPLHKWHEGAEHIADGLLTFLGEREAADS